jgi:hypothetical protein
MFLIYLGIEMIQNYQIFNDSIHGGKQLPSGIAVVLIASTYLIVDILIIIKEFINYMKNRTKNQQL